MENLEELFGQFMEGSQAQEAARDVGMGERVFADNPAPAPDVDLVRHIKANIRTALEDRRAISFRRRVYRVAAVAAAFVIFAALSVRVYENRISQQKPVGYASIMPRVIWEGNDIVADDADLATIAAAIDQIEGEMLTLDEGEGSIDAYDELLELESELVAMEGDFWKG